MKTRPSARFTTRPAAGRSVLSTTRTSAAYTAAALLATALVVASCASGGGEAETPADDDFPDVTHVLEPTDEMRTVAEQQCLDDPALEEGYVRAVAPDSGDVLAEVSVRCDEVRDGS